MADTANTHRDPPHPDESGKRAHHDQTGRSSGPYAPAGRDDQGNPVPSVPHEGLLGRIATALVAGEAVVLAAVGVAGLVTSWGADFTAQVPDTVLALRLNPAHSVLLLVTAVLAVASLKSRSLLRRFAGLQAVVLPPAVRLRRGVQREHGQRHVPGPQHAGPRPASGSWPSSGSSC